MEQCLLIFAFYYRSGYWSGVRRVVITKIITWI